MISAVGILQTGFMSPPVATAATSVGETSFTANCNPVVGADHYRLDVSTNSSFSSFVTGYNNLHVASTSQSVTGLVADTTYYYRWRSSDGVISSANSNTIEQKTDLIVAPATPTGLSVWESGIDSWSASWNSSSGATGYKIRYRVNAGTWTEELVAGTSYDSVFRYDPCDYVEVQVLAYNSAGDSAWSATQSVTINCI